MIYGTKATNTCPGKDLLIVEEGPMTRSRTKMAKEAKGLLVQATMDETRTWRAKKQVPCWTQELKRVGST